MGEAKKRGTRDERVTAAIENREERYALEAGERSWNKAQAEHRSQRAAGEEIQRRESVTRGRTRAPPSSLMLAALAVAVLGNTTK